jgi:hypothetical protein
MLSLLLGRVLWLSVCKLSVAVRVKRFRALVLIEAGVVSGLFYFSHQSWPRLVRAQLTSPPLCSLRFFRHLVHFVCQVY